MHTRWHNLFFFSFCYCYRFRSFEKAFSLAIDINDEDLFMDLHNCAKAEGQSELATDALNKAKEILDEIQKEVNSDCSRSSCSECEPESSPEPPDSPQTNEYNNVKPTKTSGNASSRLAIQPSQSHADYPPLPVFNYPRPKKSWAKEINNAPYVPPLPFASGRGSENIRVNLPKLELKVSAYSKKHSDRANQSARSRAHHPSPTYTAANLTSDNILLVDPPLPSLIRKTTSQDNLINIDVVPYSNHRLFPSSFSTDSLNQLGSNAGYPSLDTIPRALPRIHMNPSSMPVQQIGLPQKHMVIEVVPKPSTHIKPIVPAAWKVPDQTLGIPLTNIPSSNQNHMDSYHHPQYVHRPPAFAIPTDPSPSSIYAMKSQSLYNNPVIHQHPITLANIPATSSASANPYHLPNMNRLNKDPHPFSAKRSPLIVTTPPTVNSILTAAQPSPKREQNGEKNKVKFSDTVTVALVPEIARKDKPLPLGGKRTANGFNNHPSSRLTDPQRELADSLPLCHPNDDYLKDFTPVSSEVLANGNNASGSVAPSVDRTGKNNGKLGSNNGGGSIKVVHFGVI